MRFPWSQGLFMGALALTAYCRGEEPYLPPTLKLSLEAAENLALSQNKQVNAYSQLFYKAQKGKIEALSRLLPQLTVESDIYHSSRRVQGANSRQAFESQFSLTQSIISTGKYYRHKIAQIGVSLFKHLQDAAINDTLFQTRTAFYRIILDHQLLATRKEHIELLQSLSKQMEGNYNAGLAIRYNINQTKVAIANATTAYYQARRRLKTDLDQLQQVLGQEPGSSIIELDSLEIPVLRIDLLKEKIEKLRSVFESASLTGPIFDPVYPTDQAQLMCKVFSVHEMEEWENMMLENRPDLLASQAEWKMTEQELKSSEGEYVPTVDFIANYGGNPTPFFFNPSSRFNNQNMIVGLGIRINWLIFDSTGREMRIRQAKAQKNATHYQYQDVKLRAFQDLRKQIFDIEEALNTYITMEANVQLASQTLDQADQQLLVGYLSIFDYQIAIDELIRARYAFYEAEYELIKSYYGLRHASGIDIQRR